MSKTTISVGSVVELLARGQATRAVVVAVDADHITVYARHGSWVSQLPRDRARLRVGRGYRLLEGERGDVEAERAHMRLHLLNNYQVWRERLASDPNASVGF